MIKFEIQSSDKLGGNDLMTLKITRSAVTLFAMLATAFLLMGCGAAPATGWASARVVDQIVYVASTTGRMMALNAADGSVKWQFPTDKSLGSLYSTPAIVEGVVYLGSFDQISHQHRLYAIDATNGTKKWEFDPGMAIVSSPTVGNGMVYF